MELNVYKWTIKIEK